MSAGAEASDGPLVAHGDARRGNLHGMQARTDDDGWTRQLADHLVAAILEDGAALLRWLDVGLRGGEVVAAALDAGVERVDAVDPDPDAVRGGEERFDRSVVGLRVGTVEDLGGFLGPYDVVVAAGVLPSSTDPVAAMRRMRDVLTYGSTAWAVVWDDGQQVQDPTAAPLTSSDGLAAAAAAADWTGEVRTLEVPAPDGGAARTALVVTTEA